MGADWGVATEGGGRSGRLGEVLSRSSSGVAVIWCKDVNAIGDSGTEVRDSACGFPATGNKVKGKMAELQ